MRSCAIAAEGGSACGCEHIAAAADAEAVTAASEPCGADSSAEPPLPPGPSMAGLVDRDVPGEKSAAIASERSLPPAVPDPGRDAWLLWVPSPKAEGVSAACSLEMTEAAAEAHVGILRYAGSAASAAEPPAAADADDDDETADEVRSGTPLEKMPKSAAVVGRRSVAGAGPCGSSPGEGARPTLPGDGCRMGAALGGDSRTGEGWR